PCLLKAWMAQRIKATGGNRLDIAHVVEKAVHAVSNNLGNASNVSGNDRDFARHRFKRNQAERFKLTGKQEDIRYRKQLAHVVLFSNKQDIIGDSVCTSQPLRFWTIG